MTTIILIILGAVLIYFLSDMKNLNKSIEEDGGMAVRYQILLKYLLSDPASRITKQTKNVLVIEIIREDSFCSYRINQLFGEVIIEVTVKNIIHGDIIEKLKFPDKMDQNEMFNDLLAKLTSLLERNAKWNKSESASQEIIHKAKNDNLTTEEVDADFLERYEKFQSDLRNKEQEEIIKLKNDLKNISPSSQEGEAKKIIYEGEGVDEVKIGDNIKIAVSTYGNKYEIIRTKQAHEYKYEDLGMSFFVKAEDNNERIISMDFYPPFNGFTSEESISLGEPASKLSDYFFGKPHWKMFGDQKIYVASSFKVGMAITIPLKLSVKREELSSLPIIKISIFESVFDPEM